MSAYREKFPVGSQVQVVSLQEVEEFRREWKFHNKLEDNQLAFANQVFTVDFITAAMFSIPCLKFRESGMSNVCEAWRGHDV